MRGPTRRDTLKSVTAGLLASATVTPRTLAADDVAPADTVRFTHGVASGDPTQSAIILWTRAQPFDADGREIDKSVMVEWELAEDAGFAAPVAKGHAFTGPTRDYTLHVDAGGLSPGKTYFYRFKSGDNQSHIGRTRTLPEGGIEEVKLAVCSCSNYPAGYFNAYRVMAERDDIQAVLHLGDYIYEYGPAGYATRFGRGVNRIPDPPYEIVTLDDYRTRYKQYRTDQDLQAVHAAHPMIAIWDDHESANNSWVDGAQNHQPDEEGDWSARRAASVQAYFEYLPIRVRSEKGEPLTLNRSFEFGDLVTLIMLETRLVARSEQMSYELPMTAYDVTTEPPTPITDETRLATLDPENPPEGVSFMPNIPAFLESLGDPQRELLGAKQLQHIEAALATSKARNVPWQVLGNQIILARVGAPNLEEILTPEQKAALAARSPRAEQIVKFSALGLPMNFDAWDGYPAARDRLFELVRTHGSNLIAVTGDTHAYWANELYDKDGTRIGAEFGTTSINSPSIADLMNLPDFDIGLATTAANENVLINDVNNRGFLLMTFTPEAAEAEFVSVSRIDSPVFDTVRVGHFRVPATDGEAAPVERLS